MLTALDQMGIAIAVDDFGTGYASISRLHRLPVSEVKIDRSFVSDPEERSRTYLTAMIAFGRQLGLRVVAEGVEDDAMTAWLAASRDRAYAGAPAPARSAWTCDPGGA